MELKNSFLIKFMSGCLVGMFIPIIIMVCADGTEYIDSHGLILLKQIIGSMIYGGIAMGGSITYEIENWSIVKATLTHYITTMGSFLVVNYLLEWFGTGTTLVFAFAGLTVGYFFIWLTQSLLYSKRVKKVNEELNLIKRNKLK